MLFTDGLTGGRNHAGEGPLLLLSELSKEKLYFGVSMPCKSDSVRLFRGKPLLFEKHEAQKLQY
jgi:hypothetical protein